MDSSHKVKMCVEGRVNHEKDRRDYSIPLYIAFIAIVSMIISI